MLYAMYLDKPMRDHTLLQAIARVNRPYEVDEGDGDGASRTASCSTSSASSTSWRRRWHSTATRSTRSSRTWGCSRSCSRTRWSRRPRRTSKLVTHGFNDKDVDDLIEHFRDKDRRKEFFKEFKELEMLYEIISPDAFLRPFIDDYTRWPRSTRWWRRPTRSRSTSTGRSSGRRTNWCRSTSTSSPIAAVTDFVAINAQTIDLIKQKHGGDDTKVINLIKSIEKTAEEDSE